MSRMTLAELTLLLVAAVQVGCHSNHSTVAEVPPPSDPIAVAPDSSLNGPLVVPPPSAGPPTVTFGDPAPTPIGAPVAGNSYTVQRGDTLWSIARQRYGTGQKWRDIVAANPGLVPERLAVGQTINLP